MPLKKIIVPVNLSGEPKYILEYAYKLAFASNSKLSCICHSGEENTKSNNHKNSVLRKDNFLKLDFVKVINGILSETKIPYEVIITKNGISGSLENFTSFNTPYLIIIEISDLENLFHSIKNTKTPVILFKNSKK
ncbi:MULTISPECIES: hypothetical protein [unclassified Saccharicrinis]|uniref:hypothetical protein n=1 Tax=unclassified Saccharicrinis TaxID=2646859 RepID=UPI003D342873